MWVIRRQRHVTNSSQLRYHRERTNNTNDTGKALLQCLYVCTVTIPDTVCTQKNCNFTASKVTNKVRPKIQKNSFHLLTDEPPFVACGSTELPNINWRLNYFEYNLFTTRTELIIDIWKPQRRERESSTKKRRQSSVRQSSHTTVVHDVLAWNSTYSSSWKCSVKLYGRR